MKTSMISTVLLLTIPLFFVVSCGVSDNSEEIANAFEEKECDKIGGVWNGSKCEEPGSINGVVKDKTTGETIPNAAIELCLADSGTLTASTSSNSEGYFETPDVSAGEYDLLVTKPGYIDNKSTVSVTADKQTTYDIQLEKLPAALQILIDGEEKSDLDFGAEIGVVSRQFEIVNKGEENLDWQISYYADWIKEITPDEGSLKAQRTQGVVVIIDRSQLESGDNVTPINVTSNDGNKEITVKATNDTVPPTLNTLEATNVRTTSAVLNAEILTKGNPNYSKRGFVYSLESNPTLENTISDLTAAVTEKNTYSATVAGLELGKTYYVRGYAINEVDVAYSNNEVKVVPQTVLASVTTKAVSNVNPDPESASATFNGSIVDEGDPAYTERGFVYGTVHNPTIEDDTKKFVTGIGTTGDFSVNVSKLEVSTEYYVRAYVINEKGIAYGEEVTLNFKDYLPYVSVPGTNLIAAKKDAGQGDWNSAIEMCENSTLAGFNDWRLPTKNELLTLYANKDYIGNFKNATYWSSTSEDINNAYHLDFSNGLPHDHGKHNYYYVRCVRGGN